MSTAQDEERDRGCYAPTLCEACARRLPDLRSGAACTSFPEGIPIEIAVWGGDHLSTIAGEEPFELDPAKEYEYELWMNASPLSPRNNKET